MGQETWTVKKTRTFERWLRRLKDRKARGRISARVFRLEEGLLGDVRSVGEGVFELRIDYGPGYRLYGTIMGAVVIVLLCAGDKGSQKRDIARAKRMAARLKAGDGDEESL
ncbi:type II toxin-antitoxin system RelE/ParE family toxin [Eggerthella sp. YY7918]|uniref:type II toxin-antitoxin system RelE/ParE family toxin n=1 Tax=Eggerthella sp. (strain YY7918) TaxID=502558 RepID=UPI00021717BE|nr:type II toxin-antitoxin system RelE/ParE family toxin [Eggerthella sp. YY7918]BAK45077.1 uncharacterized BCR [Eggerthella sp. YY7918]